MADNSLCEASPLKQFLEFGDDRQKGWCVYCGGPRETRDHVPARVLLDEPYPENLPVVPSCHACNNSASLDEAYLACLIESAACGSIDEALRRPKVDAIVRHSPALGQLLREARTETSEGTQHAADRERVQAVVLKLARGHIAFEQNEPQTGPPQSASFAPLVALEPERLSVFESGSTGQPAVAGWPEVGSRALIRAVEGHDVGIGGWITVQPRRYRYRVTDYTVSMVISEYLAAEVSW